MLARKNKRRERCEWREWLSYADLLLWFFAYVAVVTALLGGIVVLDFILR